MNLLIAKCKQSEDLIHLTPSNPYNLQGFYFVHFFVKILGHWKKLEKWIH